MSIQHQDNMQETCEGNREASSDYIGAVSDLLHLCQDHTCKAAPDDYVHQVEKVRGHIDRILESNGVESG